MDITYNFPYSANRCLLDMKPHNIWNNGISYIMVCISYFKKDEDRADMTFRTFETIEDAEEFCNQYSDLL